LNEEAKWINFIIPSEKIEFDFVSEEKYVRI